MNYQVTKDLLDDIAKTELSTALVARNHLLQIQRSAHVGGTKGAVEQSFLYDHQHGDNCRLCGNIERYIDGLVQ